jgi:hypothetical protein
VGDFALAAILNALRRGAAEFWEAEAGLRGWDNGGRGVFGEMMRRCDSWRDYS